MTVTFVTLTFGERLFEQLGVGGERVERVDDETATRGQRLQRHQQVRQHFRRRDVVHALLVARHARDHLITNTQPIQAT